MNKDVWKIILTVIRYAATLAIGALGGAQL